MLTTGAKCSWLWQSVDKDVYGKRNPREVTLAVGWQGCQQQELSPADAGRQRQWKSSQCWQPAMRLAMKVVNKVQRMHAGRWQWDWQKRSPGVNLGYVLCMHTVPISHAQSPFVCIHSTMHKVPIAHARSSFVCIQYYAYTRMIVLCMHTVLRIQYRLLTRNRPSYAYSTMHTVPKNPDK